MKSELTIAEFPMPSTVGIERQVLADVVASPEAIGQIMGLVNADSFTDESRSRIWSLTASMYARGETIDMVSVHARMGDPFVREVITPGVLGGTAREAVNHAYALRDAAARRVAYLSAVHLLQQSIRPENTEEDLCSIAETIGRKIQGAGGVVSETHISDIMDEISDEIEENRDATEKGIKTRIPTGFRYIDWLTYQGWGPGQLVILAARPSVGKTAVMLQMAKAAAGSGFPTCVFSIEMTNSELGKRMLFSTGLVKPTDVASGLVPREGFTAAAGRFRDLPLYINERSRTLDDIVARLTLNVRAGKCRIAFIDYLGLMDSGDSRVSLNQSIGKITSTLKATAKQLKIPIILLCQLNRDAARRGDAPQLYDLRDSGSIEQDADIVIMLETESGVQPDTGRPDINMWVRKNRQYKKDVCICIRPNETYSQFTEIGTNEK